MQSVPESIYREQIMKESGFCSHKGVERKSGLFVDGNTEIFLKVFTAEVCTIIIEE